MSRSPPFRHADRGSDGSLIERWVWAEGDSLPGGPMRNVVVVENGVYVGLDLAGDDHGVHNIVA